MFEENNINGNNGVNLMEKWLTEAYDYEKPSSGEIRDGILLEVDQHGAIVDVGLKHDGIVQRRDIERLSQQAQERLKPGLEVRVLVLRADDREDNLLLSLYQVQAEEDWEKAEEMLKTEEIWTGEVIGYNRGGVLVDFGHLQGFVPASHLAGFNNRRVSPEERQDRLEKCVGQELSLKVIEVNKSNRRLIMSERLATQEMREENLDSLLEELTIGDVRPGVVRHLTDFGAFVDLGKADGLVHISELAWHHVSHPSEVVQVGDKVEVYVLDLDYERKRINLSLKRLKPDPWTTINLFYTPDQLVLGTVSNVLDFGAFVVLETGIEGLLHVSEMAEPEPNDAREFVERGNKLVLRVLQIEPDRQRMALSLKSVSPEERDEWLAQQQASRNDAPASDEVRDELYEQKPA